MNDRIVFSCPSCKYRRKTYFNNLHLKIQCPKCNHIFTVKEADNLVYKTARKPPIIKKVKPFTMPAPKHHVHVKNKRKKKEQEESTPIKLAFGLIIISVLSYYLLRFLRPDIFK